MAEWLCKATNGRHGRKVVMSCFNVMSANVLGRTVESHDVPLNSPFRWCSECEKEMTFVRIRRSASKWRIWVGFRGSLWRKSGVVAFSAALHGALGFRCSHFGKRCRVAVYSEIYLSMKNSYLDNTKVLLSLFMLTDLSWFFVILSWRNSFKLCLRIIGFPDFVVRNSE